MSEKPAKSDLRLSYVPTFPDGWEPLIRFAYGRVTITAEGTGEVAEDGVEEWEVSVRTDNGRPTTLNAHGPAEALRKAAEIATALDKAWRQEKAAAEARRQVEIDLGITEEPVERGGEASSWPDAPEKQWPDG